MDSGWWIPIDLSCVIPYHIESWSLESDPPNMLLTKKWRILWNQTHVNLLSQVEIATGPDIYCADFSRSSNWCCICNKTTAVWDCVLKVRNYESLAHYSGIHYCFISVFLLDIYHLTQLDQTTFFSYSSDRISSIIGVFITSLIFRILNVQTMNLQRWMIELFM